MMTAKEQFLVDYKFGVKQTPQDFTSNQTTLIPNPVSNPLFPNTSKGGSFRHGVGLPNTLIGQNTLTVDNSGDIITALRALESVGGGILNIIPGTYLMDKDMVIPSNTTVTGFGLATIIDFNGTDKQILVEGTSVYSTGTITAVTSGVTVTGSGTSWLANVSAGQYLLLGDRMYLIAAVTGNTTMILAEGYTDDVTLPASYEVVVPAKACTLQNLLVKGSTDTGVVATRALEFTIDNVQSILNNKGFVITKTSRFANRFSLAAANTSNGWEFTNVGLGDWSSVNSISNGGSGAVFNDVETINGLISCVANTGDGFNFTTCTDLLLTVEASGNGGQGMELVATCNGLVINGPVRGNASDGIKLTATSDKNIINTCQIATNGGWGVNIAAASCDDNLILGNIFDTNTSGELTDSGTGTLIRSNIGVADAP